MKENDLYDYPDLYHQSYSADFGRIALRRIGLTNITNDDTVLCVGAGTGIVADWIESNSGAKVYALEPHPKMREKCKSTVSGPVLDGTIEDIPLPADKVTVTVCSGGVISYASSVSDAVSELLRVTKKGGQIGVSGFHQNFSRVQETDLVNSHTRVKRVWESDNQSPEATVTFKNTGEDFSEPLIATTKLSGLDKETVRSEFEHYDIQSSSVVSDRHLVWGIRVVC